MICEDAKLKQTPITLIMRLNVMGPFAYGLSGQTDLSGPGSGDRRLIPNDTAVCAVKLKSLIDNTPHHVRGHS